MNTATALLMFPKPGTDPTPPVLPAAVLRWTVGLGVHDGNGAWDATTTENWTGDNGATRRAWAGSIEAQFGEGTSGTAGTVTIPVGGVTAGALTFKIPNAGHYTVAGSPLTLTQAAINCGDDTTITAPIVLAADLAVDAYWISFGVFDSGALTIGDISGPHGITIYNGLAITGACTVTGPIAVSGNGFTFFPYLTVTGTISGSSGVSVLSGAIAGTGTVSDPVSLVNGTLAGGTDAAPTGTLTLADTLDGDEFSSLVFRSNGTNAVSQVVQTLPSQVVDIDGWTIDCTTGHNLNAGTYTVLTLHATSTFTGTPVAGTVPANRSSMSVAIVGNLLQITVA